MDHSRETRLVDPCRGRVTARIDPDVDLGRLMTCGARGHSMPRPTISDDDYHKSSPPASLGKGGGTVPPCRYTASRGRRYASRLGAKTCLRADHLPQTADEAPQRRKGTVALPMMR